MPNPENVVGKGRPFRSGDKLSKEAQKRGGIASGKSKRARRDAREIAKMVLDFQPELPEKTLQSMLRMGMRRDAKPDMRLISTLAIMQKAMQGDRNAYAYILELAGEVVPEGAPMDETSMPILIEARPEEVRDATAD